MLSQRQLSTGDRVASDPLGTGLSKAGSSLPASPCGAEHDRQPPWGQTYSTLRSWVYENKEQEGKNQSDPRFHQLLSQGLLKKSLQVTGEVKVLGKAQRS